MADRPGGLTALAVLNFVFGGFGVIGFMGGISAWNMGILWIVSSLLGGAYSGLLIANGVGFLKQSKKLGQLMSLFCGFIGIASAALSMVNMLSLTSKFGAFGTAVAGIGAAGIVIGIAYPVLLLILPRTVFKNSFDNP